MLVLLRAGAVAAPSSDLRYGLLGAVEAQDLRPLLVHAVDQPSPAVRQQVLEAVREEPGSLPSLSRARRRRDVAQRVLAAAAVVIVAVTAGWLLRGDTGTTGDEIPVGHETQVVALRGMGPSEAAVRHFRHDNFRLTLSVSGFRPTPAGFHYAVWVQGQDGDVAVGTFRLKSDDAFDIPFAIGVNPSEYPELLVTLEPNDGDPALTGEIVTRGRFDPQSVHHGDYDE